MRLMNLSLALLQTCASPDPQENLQALDKLLDSFLQEPPDLLVLPEYCLCLGSFASLQRAARPQEDWQDLLAGRSRRLGSAILFAGLPLSEDGAVYNSALVLGPSGEILSRYDKHNLFHWSQGGNAVDEGSFFRPGQVPPAVFHWRGWKIAVTTCFDLRFPAFWQSARPRPDLYLCPAAFTDITGKAHWRPLLQARAIENLAWVAGIGLGGENQETGLALHGHSCVFDPWGRQRAGDRQRGSAVLRLVLDPDRVAECRRRLPMQPEDSLPSPDA